MPDSKTMSKKGTVQVDAGIATQDIHIIKSNLDRTKAILQAFGISSLSDLGTLNIAGNVIPHIGLLRPSTQNQSETQTQSGTDISRRMVTMISCTAYKKANKAFEKISVKANVLPAEAFRIPGGSLPKKAQMSREASKSKGDIVVTGAYWAATTINIAANTNVILQSPNDYLMIIAQNIIVGANVTFTYEHPTLDLPKQPAKPDTPGDSSGTGILGTNGTKGNPGFDGDDAPSIEMWALNFTGELFVDLGGQQGGQGGTGSDGGNGGRGAKGANSNPGRIQCKAGPGNGCPGAKGGRAGDGGNGGPGGHGGSFALYAPQSVINAITTSGFVINLNGGAGGPPGGPGQPGNGGEGGERGDITGYCANNWFNWDDRVKGATGPKGDTGSIGLQGIPGVSPSGNVIHFNPIDINEFNLELLKPAIINFSKNYAIVGDNITILGQNFTSGDIVMIDNTPAITTYSTANSLSFIVPSVKGSSRAVQIKQTDGTLSNLATLYIDPTLNVPSSVIRVKPGDGLTLKGTGFFENTRVSLLINGQNSQNMDQVNFIDKETLSFTVKRPTGITPNSSGEVTSVVVSNPPNRLSNSISIVLDTFKMLCFGDSIMWGEGLLEVHKFQWQVENAIRAANSGIGVYRTNAAHCGAIIGKGSNNDSAALDGEVPTSFPTIWKQHNNCKNQSDAPFIDLILVDGGINDLGVFTFLTPHISNQNQADAEAEIKEMAKQYCYSDMKEMLGDIASSYPKAKIIVTGYYAPISEDSFQNPSIAGLIQTFLDALAIAIPEGAVVAGVFVKRAKESIVEQTALAASEMNTNLSNAVNDVNNTLPQKRIFFANPQFEPNNAAYANNSWVFGTNGTAPEDELILERKAACEINPGDGSEFFCRHASCGHPNGNGADAYFRAIQPYL